MPPIHDFRFYGRSAEIDLQSYVRTPGVRSGYAVYGYEGVGAPPVVVDTSRLSTRAGSIVNDASIAGRRFTVYVDIIGRNAIETQQLYDDLMSQVIFTKGAGVANTGVFEHTTNDIGEHSRLVSPSRRIICGVVSGGSIQKSDRIGTNVWRVPLRFYAERPFWYSSVSKSQDVITRRNRGSLTIPVIDGLVAKANTKVAFHPLTQEWRRLYGEYHPFEALSFYDGDAISYSLAWFIAGPAINPTLWSHQTHRYVRLNVTLAEGENRWVRMGYSPSFDHQYNQVTIDPNIHITSRFDHYTQFSVVDEDENDHFNEIDVNSQPIYIIPRGFRNAAANSGLLYINEDTGDDQKVSRIYWSDEFLSW